MTVKPYSFEISSYFRKTLKEGKDKFVLVSISMDSKGKVIIRPTTSGGQHAGDYMVTPENMQEVNDFAQECLESFREMVKVNETIFLTQESES